ncbi:MAG: S8 family serine peptidase, partial [Verrucomicrobiota bacterium]
MPREPRKLSLPVTALALLAAVAGYLLATHFPGPAPLAHQESSHHTPLEQSHPAPAASTPAPATQTARSKKFSPPAGAIQNEMLLRFRNATALQAFLDQAVKSGVRVLGIIPGLNAVRIGFDTPAQADEIGALAPDATGVGFNYIATLPSAPDPSKQDLGGPYLAFANHALTWLGVPSNNSSWGEGVKVALLDTGITAVPGLSQNSISTIDLVSQSGGTTGDLRHGTAMASIIAGNSPDEPGIAPSAQLLSIAVLDGNGAGNSFTVAQGIMDAVNSGARVISMSLGSSGDSSILQDAVNYALAHDVAIVVAVGNDGIGSVSYP